MQSFKGPIICLRTLSDSQPVLSCLSHDGAFVLIVSKSGVSIIHDNTI